MDNRHQVAHTTLSWQERIDNYVRKTGFAQSLFLAHDGRVVGTWIMDAESRIRSSRESGYSVSYRRLVAALFPDRTRTLRLYSGQRDLDGLEDDTVEVSSAFSPAYVDDAFTLLNVPLSSYDLIIVSPRLTEDGQGGHQTLVFKPEIVMRGLQCCSPGTYVVWLDSRLPMYRQDKFVVEATVGLLEMTTRWFRVMTVFRCL